VHHGITQRIKAVQVVVN